MNIAKSLTMAAFAVLAFLPAACSGIHTIDTPPLDIPLYSTEAGAAKGCHGSPVVWVNTYTGVYHMKNEPWYGSAPRHGAYACKRDADASPRLRHGYNLLD